MTLTLQNLFTRRPFWVIGAGLFALQAPIASAINYGIYDSRGLAMGGAVIAVGTTSQAAFYNPALLAFHEGDEDKTLDGRAYTPTIVAQATESTATIKAAVSAAKDRLDTRMMSAITTFNADSATAARPPSANADLAAAAIEDAETAAANLRLGPDLRAAASASHNLRDALNGIANKDLTFDVFVGIAVSEPSDHEGGAFYFGSRTIGAGTTIVPPEDLTTMDAYITALDQLAATTPTAGITLISPTSALTSTANMSVLSISEWGLALAKAFTFWGQEVSFGLTPKMMGIEAYSGDLDFNTDTANQFSDTKGMHMTFNADVGIAAIFFEHYRLSVAAKNIFSKRFNTTQTAAPGLPETDFFVKLNPNSRMGIAYVNSGFSVGIDYDLEESKPTALEAPTQEASLGIEYQLFNSLALRAGYRQDQTGLRPNIISGGLGFHWHRFVADLAYAQNSEMKGGGLQLGWTF